MRIDGVTHHLWRPVDHEGEMRERFVTKTRDRMAALTFFRKARRRRGRPEVIVTDRLRTYGAALKDLGRAAALAEWRALLAASSQGGDGETETGSHSSDSTSRSASADVP